jgi:hypothetical protein
MPPEDLDRDRENTGNPSITAFVKDLAMARGEHRTLRVCRRVVMEAGFGLLTRPAAC